MAVAASSLLGSQDQPGLQRKFHFLEFIFGVLESSQSLHSQTNSTFHTNLCLLFSPVLENGTLPQKASKSNNEDNQCGDFPALHLSIHILVTMLFLIMGPSSYQKLSLTKWGLSEKTSLTSIACLYLPGLYGLSLRITHFPYRTCPHNDLLEHCRKEGYVLVVFVS